MGCYGIYLLLVVHVCMLLDSATCLWGTGSVEPVVERLAADVNQLKLQIGQLGAANTKRVAFSAFIPENGNIPSSTNQIVPFNNILTNTGGAYFNNTAVFRAPYDGDYFFIVNADVSANYRRMNLVRNKDIVIAIDKNDDVRTHVTGSGILNLRAGDVITVRHMFSRGHVDGGRDSTFSGFYLG